MMRKNIGTPDRLLRLAIAAGLLIGAWYYTSWILLAFGLFTLYEALASWCVLYQLLGINRCPIDRTK